MTIPDEDIKGVRACALSYFDVTLTDAQARTLLEADEALRDDVRACGGSATDTATRDRLAQGLVDLVMAGEPNPSNPDKMMGYLPQGWHFPMYGSDQAYRDEFHQKFREAAPRKGFVLGAFWQKA